VKKANMQKKQQQNNSTIINITAQSTLLFDTIWLSRSISTTNKKTINAPH